MQEAADWMRNLTISGEEYCAAIMRGVSPFVRRLKSLGPWRKERKGERRGRRGRRRGRRGRGRRIRMTRGKGERRSSK